MYWFVTRVIEASYSSMRTPRFLLLANLLIWTFSRPGQGAAPVATFTYSPLAIRAGDTLTFNGSNVAAGTASVHVSVRSATGVRTVLGTIPVNGAGTFSAALAVPGDVAAGMYFVNIVDGAQHAVINRTGELSIVPPGTPVQLFSAGRGAGRKHHGVGDGIQQQQPFGDRAAG
jgi:hypothetical protein